MANAARDNNRVTTLLGVSSVDNTTPTLIKVNPSTGAMLIDGTSLDARFTKVRAATLVVSASDSKDTTHADYYCDGTADQVQINQAIAALPSEGGTVLLMEGQYTISATITLASNVKLQGMGASTVIFVANSTQINAITGDTLSNVSIESLLIDGNKANQTSAGTELNQNGIFFNVITNGKIFNVWSKNNEASGALLAGSNTGCTISNNNFVENQRNGVYLNFSNNNYNTITGNICNDNVDYHGIAISQSSYNTITGNTCKGNGECGIQNDGSAIGNVIQGNTCISNDWTGIAIEAEVGGAFPTYTTVTANNCQLNSHEGIRITGSSYCVVSSNIVYNNNQAGGYDGILLNVGSGTTHPGHNRIVGNIVSTNHAYGLHIADASAPVNYVMGNDFVNNSTPYLDASGNAVVMANPDITTSKLNGGLNMNGALNNQPTGFNAITYEAQTPGESLPRFRVLNRGDLTWGDGTNAHDVTLGRSVANTLFLNNNIDVHGTANFYGTSGTIGFGYFDNNNLAGEQQYSITNNNFYMDIIRLSDGNRVNAYEAQSSGSVKYWKFFGYDTVGRLQVGGVYALGSAKFTVYGIGTTTNRTVEWLDSNGVDILHATDAGNVVVGSAALATNATNGFLYIPSSAGAPTGTPTAFTGRVALQYDTSNNDLYVYNGAWKKVALA